ncbi:MAG TPA: DUF6498-containing protein [Spirochaetota bacterium]|nr:DUF6498-containing protein [Spirochaetota bacterium]HPF05177.1 DUF6498-containing protein [Spirochaetota bacterium]HPJ41877.1 DUF6498-containing protein [Spirochaetota bacterium]HPR38475.1 DUF6498-containing protein [Spirochaetota bacterium]HRX47454.1 DUF6498-containing protein [Spirochaetota bacterium]
MISKILRISSIIFQVKTLFSTGDGRVSTGAVLLNNAVITAGFIFFNWELSAAVLIFWMEGGIAGLFGAVKLAVGAVFDLSMPDEGPVFKGLVIVILVAAYSALLSLMVFITALVLPVFIDVISDGHAVIFKNGGDLSDLMTGLLHYLKMEFFPFPGDCSLSSIRNFLTGSKFGVIISIVTVQAYLFFRHFIKRKLFLVTDIKKLIIRPTGRFFMIYILLGVFFLPFAGCISWSGTLPPVLLWMAGKTLYDLYGGYIDILADEKK